MAYQCPGCQREFEMETEFCPACGGPMNPEAYRISQKNAEINGRLLPIKWYKFLIWFSIPVSILLLLYNLYASLEMLFNFDPALFRPELLHLVRISLYMDLGVQAILLPMMGYGEYALVKKKWKGVKTLLLIYALQAVYGAVGIVILMMAKADAPDVLSTVFSIVQTIVMFILNRIYFNKRKSMFSF